MGGPQVAPVSNGEAVRQRPELIKTLQFHKTPNNNRGLEEWRQKVWHGKQHFSSSLPKMEGFSCKLIQVFHVIIVRFGFMVTWCKSQSAQMTHASWQKPVSMIQQDTSHQEVLSQPIMKQLTDRFQWTESLFVLACKTLQLYHYPLIMFEAQHSFPISDDKSGEALMQHCCIFI